jgi:hypothetical protein
MSSIAATGQYHDLFHIRVCVDLCYACWLSIGQMAVELEYC